jgi:ribonuclease HI
VKKTRVWVDGSFLNGVGAYAILIRGEHHDVMDGRSFYVQRGGINLVELMAVTNGLRIAKRMNSSGQIIVHTDSNYVTSNIRWLNDWWRSGWRKANGWEMVSFHEQWAELRGLLISTQARVTLRGRCSTPELLRVDEHAKLLRRRYEEALI